MPVYIDHMKGNWIIVAMAAAMSCGPAEDPVSRTAGFSVDTILMGHPVRLVLRGSALKPGMANEIDLSMDSTLGHDWSIFTRTPEATIKKDSISGLFHITPTGLTDSVNVYFGFPDMENRYALEHHIAVPVRAKGD